MCNIGLAFVFFCIVFQNFVIKRLQRLPPTRYHWFTGLTDSGHEGYWGFDSTFNMPPQDGFM